MNKNLALGMSAVKPYWEVKHTLRYDSENGYFYLIEKIKEFINKYGYDLYSELSCANAVLRP